MVRQYTHRFSLRCCPPPARWTRRLAACRQGVKASERCPVETSCGDASSAAVVAEAIIKHAGKAVVIAVWFSGTGFCSTMHGLTAELLKRGGHAPLIFLFGYLVFGAAQSRRFPCAACGVVTDTVDLRGRGH